MRVCDLDTSGELWVYRPARHKTRHHGHIREVFLGPRARAIVRPFLTTELSAHVFRPDAALAERRANDHARRKTPLSCGNRPGSNRKRDPRRGPGDAYDVDAYRRAIARGCDRAFQAPEALQQTGREAELMAWRSEHRWHPHRLRHTAATQLRRRYGLEAAQVILGHRTLTVTQAYAEKNVPEKTKRGHVRIRGEDEYRLERPGLLALREYTPGQTVVAGGKAIRSRRLLKHWTGADLSDALGLKGRAALCRDVVILHDVHGQGTNLSLEDLYVACSRPRAGLFIFRGTNFQWPAAATV